MVFKSKRDLWIGLLIWSSMIFGLVMSIAAESVFSIVIMILFILLFGWVWFYTLYIITDGDLIIKSGPWRKTIALCEIESVKKTMNPLSAPALSLKRLEVKWRKSHIALISPKNDELFINELKKRCSSIKTD